MNTITNLIPTFIKLIFRKLEHIQHPDSADMCVCVCVCVIRWDERNAHERKKEYLACSTFIILSYLTLPLFLLF